MTTDLVSQFDWAWLAGFVDGEGSIGIAKERGRRKDGDPSLRASLQISNTNRVSLVRALWIMGVPDHCVAVQPRLSPTHATQYHIAVRGARLIEVLPRLMPYLVIKRKQAQLVLLFALKRAEVRKRGRYAAFGPLERYLHGELAKLNLRGPERNAV